MSRKGECGLILSASVNETMLEVYRCCKLCV